MDIEKLVQQAQRASLEEVTRRHFLRDCSLGLGAIALAGLLPGCSSKTASTNLNDLINPLQLTPWPCPLNYFYFHEMFFYK